MFDKEVAGPSTAVVGPERKSEKHLEQLKRAIRRVDYGEEITYEQFVLADTPPSKDFLIIDRQVTDSTLKGKRMDLLALGRMPDGPYRLVMLEVKLGKNPELAGAVIDQLALYTDHLNRRDVLAEYGDCYETAYAQKHKLGLYPREMPDRVAIDREAAEGVIVAIGYATRARGHLDSLRSAPGGSRLKVVEFSHDLSAGTPISLVRTYV